VSALEESVSSQAFVQSYRSNCAAKCSAQMQAVQVSSPPEVSPPVVVLSSGVPSGAPAVDSSLGSSGVNADGFNSLYAIPIVLVLVLVIVAAVIYYRSLPDNNESSKFRVSNSVEDQMDMGKVYGSNMDDELASNPLYLSDNNKPW